MQWVARSPAPVLTGTATGSREARDELCVADRIDADEGVAIGE